MGDQKYYWLKLNKDFFERPEIQIVESAPNGSAYVIFYLKLLLKSMNECGRLEYHGIPYNLQMLSKITGTDIDTARCAVEMFSRVGLMEMLDDGTYFMSEVERLTGSLSASPEAEKKRLQRERKKALGDTQGTKCPDNVPENGGQKGTDCPQENKENKENKDIKDINKTHDQNERQKTLVEEFEDLWKMYPKKQGRKRAQEAYMRARKNGTTFDDVKSGIEKYVRYIRDRNVEDRYVKQGGTFFFGNSWTDEYSVDRKGAADDFAGIFV